jgi:hypothetical protein
VFYDDYEKVNLWGKDLYAHLDYVYSKAARYCVIFVSKAYAKKLWTNHERQSAQARAFQENQEYILPARFDSTPIPGIRPTIGYIDLAKLKPKALSRLIVEKVGRHRNANYLPPMPDLLLRAMADEYGEVDPVLVYTRAARFLEALRRTDEDEREIVLQLLLHGCIADLPENVHINADLLRRLTKFTQAKVRGLLSGLRSLGFYSSLRKQKKSKKHLGEDLIVVLEWHDMTFDDMDLDTNATDVAHSMVGVAPFGHCDDCGLDALRRLDFSHLSTLTIQTTLIDPDTNQEIPDTAKELRAAFPVKMKAKPRPKHDKQ